MACFQVGFPVMYKYARARSSKRCSFVKPSSSFYHPFLCVSLGKKRTFIRMRSIGMSGPWSILFQSPIAGELRHKFSLLVIISYGDVTLSASCMQLHLHGLRPPPPPLDTILDAPRIQFSQFCEKKLGERFSSLSAKISRPSLNFGKPVSATRNMASSFENRQVLDSKSPSPSLFDGTTRLYFNARCPYAHRVWVAVKYKGLDEIECVEISLSDKPLWYKEKLYPVGKVPALEHDGRVTGESMDLLTYLDEHFGGPKLAPTEESKKQAAAEILGYADTFNKLGFTGLRMKDSTPEEIGAVVAPAFDFLENALGKFSSEGPFLLGDFGLVDIAYAPFIERFEVAFGGIRNYDIKASRPKLTKWIEALDNVEAYSSTKAERNTLLELYKKLLDSDYFNRVGVVSDQSNSGGTPVAVN